MMKKFLLLLLICISFNALSQNSNLTILCIAAHPDDEDGATLAYYSKLKDYDAYTIFYTRGEGGQNEIGPELYDELGRIREQECYNAAEIQGSKAYFLGFFDFGYSKTSKETFRIWKEDSVLTRIVYMIRLIRPDVVISNHDTITTKPKRQHGHHQVSGIIIYEAFDKAADPNYHPEQLVNGIEPWQVKKLYFRQNDSIVTDVFEIDVSKRDASGKSIEEIYYDALAEHKTQGMDKVERNYRGKRRYELIRSDKMYPVTGDDLFEGLVPTEKPDLNIDLKSYPTYYSYKTVNQEDSLKILNEIINAKIFKRIKQNVKIGLVKSYDNVLENVLNALGLNYDTLSSDDLNQKDLSVYSVILLDIRAYLYRPDLIENNNRILKYNEDGGNVICFYNKPGEWNGKNYSPYPIYLTSERVTEENAKVNLLTHRYTNGPFHVGENDWEGWVQERSIYLPSDDTSKTSSKYGKVFSMNDEDDPVPSTSLLWTKYGKGEYIYNSLALYRQLKIFNPGALKLFINMVSRPASWQKIILH